MGKLNKQTLKQKLLPGLFEDVHSHETYDELYLRIAPALEPHLKLIRPQHIESFQDLLAFQILNGAMDKLTPTKEKRDDSAKLNQKFFGWGEKIDGLSYYAKNQLADNLRLAGKNMGYTVTREHSGLPPWQNAGQVIDLFIVALKMGFEITQDPNINNAAERWARFAHEANITRTVNPTSDWVKLVRCVLEISDTKYDYQAFAELISQS